MFCSSSKHTHTHVVDIVIKNVITSLLAYDGNESDEPKLRCIPAGAQSNELVCMCVCEYIDFSQPIGI